MKTNVLMLAACLSMSGVAMAEHHDMSAMSADHKMDMSADHKMKMSADHKMKMSADHKMKMSADQKKMHAAHKKMHADHQMAKHHDMPKDSMRHSSAQAAIVPTQASMTGKTKITAPSAKEMMTPEQVRALEAQRWENAGKPAAEQHAAPMSAPPVPTMAQLTEAQIQETKTVNTLAPSASVEMSAPMNAAP
jgi:hypothetical protein